MLSFRVKFFWEKWHLDLTFPSKYSVSSLKSIKTVTFWFFVMLFLRMLSKNKTEHAVHSYAAGLESLDSTTLSK